MFRYPDIAVGAYKSQRAIVFRSKPVLKTKLLIRAIPNTLERDAEQFLIEICLRYEGYNVQKVQGKLHIFINVISFNINIICS